MGHHDPARVLREDYSPENFVPGPLVEAMRSGAYLYVEEFNRAPEDTLNTLLTAMAERRIAVPRVGTVEAAASFRVIASMNPYDTIGTTRLSTSVHDRLCRLAIGYQDAEAERGIVVRPTELQSRRLVADAVALTRATRRREDLRQGGSVRGAIDVALVAAQLAAIRGVLLRDDPEVAPPRGLSEEHTDIVLDAMLLALSRRCSSTRRWRRRRRRCSGRAGRTTSCSSRPRRSLLKDSRFRLPGHPARPSGADQNRGMRPLRRKPKQLTEQPVLYEASHGGDGLALFSGDRRPGRTAAIRAGGTGSGTTDESADLTALADLTAESETDELTRGTREADHPPALGAAPAARRALPPRRGGLASLSWSGGSDELDLERRSRSLASRTRRAATWSCASGCGSVAPLHAVSDHETGQRLRHRADLDRRRRRQAPDRGRAHGVAIADVDLGDG